MGLAVGVSELWLAGVGECLAELVELGGVWFRAQGDEGAAGAGLFGDGVGAAFGDDLAVVEDSYII